MTGIMKTAMPGYEAMDVLAALEAAAGYGLDGCLFSHLLDVALDLDAGRLAEVRARGVELGVKPAAGIGWINPHHLDRAAALVALGGGDYRRGFARAIEAAAAFGLTDLFFMISLIEDRFDTDLTWSGQLAASTRFLASLAPILRANGVRLLLKTHEEITTQEILRVIEAVGEDAIGVALDPVNVMVRLEEPLAAARRVAPYVRQVHLDDAIIRFAGDGIRRILHPLGQGQIDWPGILALVGAAPRFLEMHRGQFAMPVFEPGWLAPQSDVVLPELAALLEMAVASGDAPDAWNQDLPLTRLPATLEALRP
ncbi:sugar phosphate isomerase/epimerase [Mesorhizobium sp. BR1-1-16]|uniref:sugar phosphate isomerase/epimerase family protein n=1 Tax=Mesorhizobium sp. BR1-1-16 TaxID=2876653 RepID=UPI001CCCF125|nr:TIM barrel protein [Mesorhizobium sp. BR1-1-16]MBZ9939415.1 sugar phosphate isomerase/epimerase [Mesorhizobium sp. BR1-1-16]